MMFFTFFTIIAIILHPFWHARLIKNNIWIDHAYHAMLAFCVIMLLSIIGMLLGAEILDIVFVLISVPAFRWVAHDAILNILRKKGINYIGEEKNRSEADQFLQKVWDQWGVAPVVSKSIFFLSCLSITIYLMIIV